MKQQTELSCIIGGQQGEGIESVGEILAKAMGRVGYYTFGSRTFSSRIKGGHTDFNLRISKEYVYNTSEQSHIIFAFDKETIQLHQDSLVENGIILVDPKTVNLNEIELRQGIHAFEFPFSELATEIGSTLMKNIVAVGAACALLNQPLEVFEQAISEQFKKKGDSVVEKNVHAVRKGYQYLLELMDVRFSLEQAIPGQRIFLSGNDAIALGAILGGCRFMAGYPITPASEVLENLMRLIPKYGGVVVQAEDELASAAMIIGAGYAGTRAMTATAGPGLSLMQEAIGLAGATEIPIVIVDCQRGGPSSGMATKIEQSDLNAMIGGSHGESPRIVLAPSSVEEALLVMPKAFNLAERFQCPVFIASDLMIATSKQSFDIPDFSQIEINRGKLISNEELFGSEEPIYKRFAPTEDGITPRSIPGQKKGMHHVTGIEHGPTGHPSENPDNRIAQVNKRMKRLQNVPQDDAIKYEGEEKTDILLVGFGSTYGAIRDARKQIEKLRVKVGHAHIRMVHPLPITELSRYLDQSSVIIVIEQNSTGQLANIIKQHADVNSKLYSCLKYNGVPFSSSDIISFYKNLEVPNLTSVGVDI
ncbi:2-oxoacid:acceptor oxidoreductase subunit alpha [Bacillus sp. JJ1532]|uniref:2-oxoacid:acceptor oxidoreductase subunit alpha n=1 Tax=Bacillus sp. JJ1532 TaxID=3122958 RepID=UPI00300090CE